MSFEFTQVAKAEPKPTMTPIPPIPAPTLTPDSMPTPKFDPAPHIDPALKSWQEGPKVLPATAPPAGPQFTPSPQSTPSTWFITPQMRQAHMDQNRMSGIEHDAMIQAQIDAQRSRQRLMGDETKPRVHVPALVPTSQLQKAEPIRFMIDGLVAEDSVNLIIAEAKTGKTTFTAGLMRAIVTGDTFLGRTTDTSWLGHAPRVAMIQPEMDTRRTTLLLDQVSLLDRDDVFVMDHTTGPRFDILDPETLHAYAASFKSAQIDVLYLDGLTAILSAAGLDENHAVEVERFFAALRQLRQAAGISTIFISHHVSKAGDTRGSQRIFEAVDNQIKIVESDGIRTLTVKGRDVYLPAPLSFVLNPLTGALELADTTAHLELNVPTQTDQEATQTPKTKAKEDLNALRRDIVLDLIAEKPRTPEMIASMAAQHDLWEDRDTSWWTKSKVSGLLKALSQPAHGALVEKHGKHEWTLTGDAPDLTARKESAIARMTTKAETAIVDFLTAEGGSCDDVTLSEAVEDHAAYYETAFENLKSRGTITIDDEWTVTLTK